MAREQLVTENERYLSKILVDAHYAVEVAEAELLQRASELRGVDEMLVKAISDIGDPNHAASSTVYLASYKLTQVIAAMEGKHHEM